VLRTLGVFVAGVLLSIVILGSLMWAVYALPWSVRIYAYFIVQACTGGAVGLFVAFLQKRMAGVVGLICLLPLAYVQYVNRFSHPATGLRLVVLLLGTAIGLSTAFLTAHRLSKSRSRVRVNHTVPSKS
jgi:hypothetical protein